VPTFIMNHASSAHADKQELRRQLRAKAAPMVPHAPRWSVEICERLIASPLYERADSLMLFLPLPPPALEPDLTAVAEHALAAGKRLCLPRVDWEAGVMEPAALTTLDGLTTTRHGMREPPPPPASLPILVEELDLILVPGLAFDLTGNRLGRGAGFYDRFLAGRRPGTIACGVCFEAQLVDRIPTDSWDVPMNTIATERR
jgi:5-formyltetrahydrofolate cyclo-ligase